jgi:hypothetical protein
VRLKAVTSLIVVTSVVSALGVGWALVSTSPSSIGPVGVTIWFVGVVLALTGTVSLLSFVVRLKLNPMGVRNAQLSDSLRQGFLVATSFSVLLGLQSLRQLSWKDLLLILILVTLIEFYFRTRK